MKKKLFILIEYLLIFVTVFLIIYAYIFFGGWKLFESGDHIRIELGVSVIISFVVFFFVQCFKVHESKIKELEKRVDELETKFSEKK